MQSFEYSNSSPLRLLACDQAFLDEREENGGDDLLLFWESPSPFVVLGYTDRARSEANFEACRAANLPILRRCSGGGTVVQGRGCLSYSLILRIGNRAETENLSATNRFIMSRIRDALQPLSTQKIEVHGVSDLTADGRKFSGNAQRRRREFLLFHGTFLLDFDLDLMFRVLEMPTRQPQYRAQRPHRDFVTNLPLSPYAVKKALRAAWNVPAEKTENSDADRVLDSAVEARIEALARDVYAQDSWNFKL